MTTTILAIILNALETNPDLLFKILGGALDLAEANPLVLAGLLKGDRAGAMALLSTAPGQVFPLLKDLLLLIRANPQAIAAVLKAIRGQ